MKKGPSGLRTIQYEFRVAPSIVNLGEEGEAAACGIHAAFSPGLWRAPLNKRENRKGKKVYCNSEKGKRGEEERGSNNNYIHVYRKKK